jgi:hypothetical protein
MMIQTPPPVPTVARGDRFQILVPQGWKVTRAAADVAIEHSTGASLLVRRPAQFRSEGNLDTFAKDAVERIMAPLGFAKSDVPRRFRKGDEESVYYEIQGNRLSERRRILYRAVRHPKGVVEVVYEHSEERFDVLLIEAQSIASSLQILVETPVPDRRRR